MVATDVMGDTLNDGYANLTAPDVDDVDASFVIEHQSVICGRQNRPPPAPQAGTAPVWRCSSRGDPAGKRHRAGGTDRAWGHFGCGRVAATR